jgi:hypothetical protein
MLESNGYGVRVMVTDMFALHFDLESLHRHAEFLLLLRPLGKLDGVRLPRSLRLPLATIRL